MGVLSRFVLALFVGGVISSCRSGPGDALQTPVEGAYLNLGPEASYVGIETCGSCHREQYETFIQAEMGRSFRQGLLSNSDANFVDPEPIYDPDHDLYYLPFHRGEELFVMEYRVAGRDTLHKRVEQIDYIVGSGHHTNSHMREENGYLYQIPVTWYAQAGRWDLAPGFRGDEGKRFDRPIPEACMTCHNAMPGFVEGSENRYDYIPLGIDCERCHGPGSIHVEQKRAGHFVDVSQEIDYTIVNPAKLPPELQLNVCERCHTQGAAVYLDGMGPADFRPGMRLEDVENVFMVRFPDSTANFTMASHPVRLRASACFRGSHEAGSVYAPMTCLTCHDPHVSIKTLDEAAYNQPCRSCHTPERGLTCTEPEVVRAGATGNCVACHMPTSGTSDIPHVSITDHFIRIPDARGPVLSANEVAARRQVVRLASLIADSPTNRAVAEGFMTYYEEITNPPGLLDSAAVRLERARAEEPLQLLAPSLIRLGFLRADYAAVRTVARQIDTGALDAWSLYRVGEAFAKSAEYDAAIGYLRQAVALAPDHLRFRRQLGAANEEAGQFHAALAEYDAILAEDPTFEDAYNNRGFVRLQIGDMAAAETDFLAALRLNPDAEMALANVASLYFNTGRQAEAILYAERLVSLFPDNSRYRQFWELLNGAGR